MIKKPKGSKVSIIEVKGLDEFKEQSARFGFNMKGATRRIAVDMAEACRANAPVDSGDLAASIAPYENGSFVGGAVCTIWYGHFPEYGTVSQTAQFFMRRGFESVAQKIPQIYADEAQRQLDSKIKPSGV